MQRILVWDLPTRLFHWLLAGCFAGAFLIANLVDDDASAFKLHMLLGAVMAFMVVLRVIWGFVGSRWSRLASFAFGPSAVVDYVKGVITGEGQRHVGHNPGSSWGIFALLALTLSTAITGANIGTGGELFEELHEVSAFTLLAVVGVHIAGVVLHTLRHRENITLSMIDGRKQGEPRDAIAGPRAVVGLLFVALTVAWGYGLVGGYDAASSRVTLPLLGKTILLGEAEEGAEAGPEAAREHEEQEDDD